MAVVIMVKSSLKTGADSLIGVPSVLSDCDFNYTKFNLSLKPVISALLCALPLSRLFLPWGKWSRLLKICAASGTIFLLGCSSCNIYLLPPGGSSISDLFWEPGHSEEDFYLCETFKNVFLFIKPVQ